jgi:hypothetical protein
MTRARLLAGAAALGAGVVVAVALAGRPVRAYQDTAATIANPSSDITDVYLFPSPTNPNNVVAVMDVYPLIPAGQASSTFFNRSVLYQMKFDTKLGSTGHIPVENLVIQFSVGAPSNGIQQVYVYGPAGPVQTGSVTKVIANTGSGIVGKAFTADNGLLTVFAGARENPAFYDRAQLLKIIPNRNQGSNAASCLPSGNNTCPQGFNNPGVDSQNNNVLSFVVEMPRTVLTSAAGNTKVAYWATTSSETGN